MSLFEAGDEIQLEDKNYYEELVGEGKKFKTNEDLAKSKAEADAFIERIKEENARLRNDLAAKATIEEFLQKANKAPEEQKSAPSEPEKGGLKKEEVADLFKEMLRETEAERQKRQNLEEVTRIIAQVHGPNYAKATVKIAADLGLSVQEAQSLAETKPKLFVELFGRKEKSPFVNPLNTQINTGGTDSTPKKGKKYFDKILKEQGRAVYFSPQVQREMFEAAKAFGSVDEFERN